jgi:hypothetical protein
MLVGDICQWRRRGRSGVRSALVIGELGLALVLLTVTYVRE